MTIRIKRRDKPTCWPQPATILRETLIPSPDYRAVLGGHFKPVDMLPQGGPYADPRNTPCLQC